jgi:hypothetical protein
MSRRKSTPKTTSAAGGPKTVEGRKRSAMNALRHGVLSDKMIVLQSEKQEYYDKLRREYYEELNPVGLMEAELVDEMIWAKWRQRRCIIAETATIDMQMDDEAAKLRPDIEDALRSAHAIRTISNESNDLAHLSRYETRFHRMFHRAFRQLLELQDRRKRDGQTIETTETTTDRAPASAAEKRSQPDLQRAEKAKLPNELAEPGSRISETKNSPPPTILLPVSLARHLAGPSPTSKKEAARTETDARTAA